MVYLIHFDKKFHHACHYIGFCEEGRLSPRMEKHMRGEGSFLMKAVTKAGIKWSLVRIWPGETRTFERSLKNYKKSSHFCPICNERIDLSADQVPPEIYLFSSSMILIDKPRKGYSHMVCSSIPILHAIAEKAGIRKSWFQNKRGKNRPHYDVKEEFFQAAVDAGATVVESRQLLLFLKKHFDNKKQSHVKSKKTKESVPGAACSSSGSELHCS